MNYAVMYEFASTKLRSVQGAVQPDQERTHRLHLQGHRDRHAEQRHALLFRLAGFARRADRAVGSAGGAGALLLGHVRDGNTFNYGYIGSRATGRSRGLHGRRSGLEGRTPPGIKKVFRSSTQFSLADYRTQLFNPDDMPDVKKVQAGYKVQPLSAYLKQPPPPAAPRRLSEN